MKNKIFISFCTFRLRIYWFTYACVCSCVRAGTHFCACVNLFSVFISVNDFIVFVLFWFFFFFFSFFFFFTLLTESVRGFYLHFLYSVIVVFVQRVLYENLSCVMFELKKAWKKEMVGRGDLWRKKKLRGLKRKKVKKSEWKRKERRKLDVVIVIRKRICQ